MILIGNVVCKKFVKLVYMRLDKLGLVSNGTRNFHFTPLVRGSLVQIKKILDERVPSLADVVDLLCGPSYAMVQRRIQVTAARAKSVLFIMVDDIPSSNENDERRTEAEERINLIERKQARDYQGCGHLQVLGNRQSRDHRGGSIICIYYYILMFCLFLLSV